MSNKSIPLEFFKNSCDCQYQLA